MAIVRGTRYGRAGTNLTTFRSTAAGTVRATAFNYLVTSDPMASQTDQVSYRNVWVYSLGLRAQIPTAGTTANVTLGLYGTAGYQTNDQAIAGDTFNLRATPSTSGTIVTSVTRGTILTITSEQVTIANGYVWRQASFSTYSGWVASNFLFPFFASQTSAYLVAAASQPLKATASYAASTVVVNGSAYSVPPGTVLRMKDSTVTVGPINAVPNQGVWRYVDVMNGTTVIASGYLECRYISLEFTQQLATATLPGITSTSFADYNNALAAGVPVVAGQRFQIAAVVTNAALNVAYGVSTQTISSVGTYTTGTDRVRVDLFQTTASALSAPLLPIGLDAAAYGWHDFWFDYDENAAPETPIGLQTQFSADNQPVFVSEFRDQNGAYGSSLGYQDRGDNCSKFVVTIRNKATTTVVSTQTFLPPTGSWFTSTTLSGTSSGYTYTYGTAYEWSVVHYDRCGEASPASAWTTFTVVAPTLVYPLLARNNSVTPPVDNKGRAYEPTIVIIPPTEVPIGLATSVATALTAAVGQAQNRYGQYNTTDTAYGVIVSGYVRAMIYDQILTNGWAYALGVRGYTSGPSSSVKLGLYGRFGLPGNGLARVTAANTVLRSIPDTTGTNLGTLALNTILTCVDGISYGTSGTSWRKVNTDTGTVGYIQASLLADYPRVDQTAYVNFTGGLTLRSQPTTTASGTAVANKAMLTFADDVLYPLRDGYYWRRVIVNGVSGYLAYLDGTTNALLLSTDFVDLIGSINPVTVTSTSAATYQQNITTAGGDVVVKLYAGSRYAVAIYNSGSTFNHLQTSVNTSTHYNQNNANQLPVPYTNWTTTGNNGAILAWIRFDSNLPPEQPPVASMVSLQTDETTVTFSSLFRDRNGRYADNVLFLDRGDTCQRVMVEVRDVLTQTIQSNSWLPTIKDDTVSVTWTGLVLDPSLTYEWRVTHYDTFLEAGPASNWVLLPRTNNPQRSSATGQSLPPAIVVGVAPQVYSGPGTQVYSQRPDLKVRWLHPNGAMVSGIRFTLATNPGFSNPQTATQAFTIVSDPSAIRTIPYPLAGSLTRGQTYYAKIAIQIDGETQWHDVVDIPGFRVNTAPSLPSVISVTDASNSNAVPVFTGTPSFTTTIADQDDSPRVNDVNNLTAQYRLKLPDGTYSGFNEGVYSNNQFVVTPPSDYYANQYGIVQIEIRGSDGELLSDWQTGKFRYSVPGTTTADKVINTGSGRTDKTGRLPDFYVQWNSAASRKANAITVELSLTGGTGFTAIPSLSVYGRVLPAQVASGSTVVINAAQLGFSGTLATGTTYYWRALLADEDGVAGFMSGIKSFVVSQPPVASNPQQTASLFWGATTQTLSMSVTDPDGDTSYLEGVIRLQKPDGSIVYFSAPYNAVANKYQRVFTSVELTQFGTYTWSAAAYDKLVYSGGANTAQTATYLPTQTFVFTGKGTITNTSPPTYTSANQTTLTPTFQGTWYSYTAGALDQLTLELADDDSFSTILRTYTYVFPSKPPSGAVVSLTWAMLGNPPALSPDTYYWYRLRGSETVAANAFPSNDSTPVRFKTDAIPEVPYELYPNSGVGYEGYPLLRARIDDADDPTAVVGVIKLQRPDNSIVTSLIAPYNPQTGYWEFQLTATHVPTWGTYHWSMTAYDQLYYAGGATTLAAATYSDTETFMKVVAGRIEMNGAPLPYIFPGFAYATYHPSFYGIWIAGQGDVTLAALDLEIYDSTGANRVRYKYGQQPTLETVDNVVIAICRWPNDPLFDYLAPGQSYRYRLRGVDSNGTYTPWSSTVLFKVNSLPNAPRDVSPSGVIPIGPVLMESTFSDPDSGDNLTGARFQLEVVNSNNTRSVIWTKRYTATPLEQAANKISFVYLPNTLGAYQTPFLSPALDPTKVYYLTTWHSDRLLGQEYPVQYGNPTVTRFSFGATFVEERSVEVGIDNTNPLAEAAPPINIDVKCWVTESFPYAIYGFTDAVVINSTQALPIEQEVIGYVRDQRIPKPDNTGWRWEMEATVTSVTRREDDQGMMVRFPGTTGDWQDDLGWRTTEGELMTGATFVSPSFARGRAFVSRQTAKAIGIGIAIDPKVKFVTTQRPGYLEINLRQKTNGLWSLVDTNSIPTTQFYQLLQQEKRATGLPAWIVLPLNGNVTLQAGTEYSFDVRQTNLVPNVLITDNAVGRDNVKGRVLNGFVVVDTRPTPDGRPWFIGPWVGEGTITPTSLTLQSSPPVVESIFVGPRSTLAFSPDHDITLQLSRSMTMGGTFTAISGTIDGRPARHRILLRDSAGIMVNGLFQLVGAPKTRYGEFVADYKPASYITRLDRFPVGWQVGDRTYIQESTTGARGHTYNVESVTNEYVTFGRYLNQFSDRSSYVVNLSRSVEIESDSGAGRLAFFPDAIIELRHASLRRLTGNPSLYFPPTSTVTLDDLIVETSSYAISGIELDYSHQVHDLTIISNDNASLNEDYAPAVALYVQSGLQVTGELVLIDSGTVDVKGAFTGRIVAISPRFPAPKGIVTLQANATFSGSIVGLFMRKSIIPILLVAAGSEKVLLQDSIIWVVDQRNAYGIVTVGEKSTLFALDVRRVNSNYPWASLLNNATLASAQVLGSTTAAPALVTTAGNAFVRLFDDAVSGATNLVNPIVDGASTAVAAGSEVADRTRSLTSTGTITVDPAQYQVSGAALRLTADTGQVTRELGRTALVLGEVLAVQATVYGTGTLLIDCEGEQRQVSFNQPAWQTITLSITAVRSGVAILTVTTASTCWIDLLQRITL